MHWLYDCISMAVAVLFRPALCCPPLPFIFFDALVGTGKSSGERLAIGSVVLFYDDESVLATFQKRAGQPHFFEWSCAELRF